LQLEPGGKQQSWSVGHRPVAFGALWQVPGCPPNSLFADTTVIGLRRGRDLRGRGRLGWARLRWRLDGLRWRHTTLAEVRISIPFIQTIPKVAYNADTMTGNVIEVCQLPKRSAAAPRPSRAREISR
jgi:hypothetical protein